MIYLGNCTEFSAEFVQNITGYDTLNNQEIHYYHPEEYKISKEEFFSKTGVLQDFDFYGMNNDMYFTYCEENNIHFFYGN